MDLRRKLCAFLAFAVVLSLFAVYPAMSVSAAQEKLESDLYYVDSNNGYVFDVDEGTTVGAFLNAFVNDAEGMTVYSAEGLALSDSAIVATGNTVTNDADTAQVVVLGDLNSDGYFTSADAFLHRLFLVGGVSLDGVYYAAADVDYDGTITSSDYSMLKTHLAGKIDIYEFTHPDKGEVSVDDSSTDVSVEDSSVEDSSEEISVAPTEYTVSFIAGNGGSLSGTTSYTVAPGSDFSAISVPAATANDGYVFTGWTPAFPATVDSNLTFTANFVETIADNEKNYASAVLGGQYILTYGHPYGTEDKFVCDETYGSGMLNDGELLYDTDDAWLDVSRSLDQIVVEVKLAQSISMTKAVINVGLLENSGNRALPDSVTVYTATPDGEDTYFGMIYSSNYEELDDFGFLATVEGTADNVVTVKFICAMSEFIGRLGEVEVYGYAGASEAPTYTVEFSAGANGSLNGASSYTVDAGAEWGSITVPTPVANAGYVFKGWTPALPDSTDTINANAAYVAEFEYDASQYATVTFVAGDNGTINGTSAYTVLKGTKWSEIGVPTCTADAGYKFDAWTPSFPETVTEDATYTATFVYDADQYATVKFVAGANGSISGTAEYTVLKGTSFDSIKLPETVAEQGYRFDSWSPTLPATVAGDATYTANFVYDESQYATITFVAGANGTISGTAEYTVLKGTAWSEITVPSYSANTGYKFVSWTPSFPDTITESATYTANFSVDNDQYATVLFVAGNGGTLSGTTSYTVLKGSEWSEITVPEAVASAGYKFASWSGTFPVTVDGDLTFTANFEYDASQYATITFVAGANGSLSGTTEFTVLKGTAMSDIAVPTAKGNAGYKFDSWSPALSSTVTDDATYTANFVYDASQYATITFIAGDNGTISGTDEFTVLIGTVWSEIAVPTYTADVGYKFDSWSPAFPSSVTGDAVYTANFVYDASQYATVTFVAGANGTISGTTSQTVLIGTAWSKISVPTYSANVGYKFDSWSPAFPATVTVDATYTANFVYDASQYATVTFASGEGGSISGVLTQTVLKGTAWSEISIPNATASYGYTFGGWDKTFPTTVTADDTYTAVFNAIPTYSVVFVAGSNGTIEGTWYFDGILEGTLWGDVITVPTPVADSGYVFDSWSPVIPSADTPITSELTFTAQFAKETATTTRPNYASAANGGGYAYVTGATLDGYKDPNFVITSTEKTSGYSSTTYNFGTGYLNDDAIVVNNDGNWVEVARASTSGWQGQSNVIVIIVKLASAKSDIEQVVLNLGEHASSSNRGLPDNVTVKYSTRSSMSSSMSWSTMGTASTYEHISGYGYRATISNSSSRSIKYLQITLSMSSFYAARIGDIQVLGPEVTTISRNISFLAGANGSLSGTTSFTVADGASWGSITVPTPVAKDGYKFSHWTPSLPASTSTITASATYTAVFTEKLDVDVDNYALSTNGGQYMITTGTVQTGYPDSFDSNSGYGSGYLNNGATLTADTDPWVEVSRSNNIIGVTFKLSEPITMTSAVMNLGLRNGSSNRVLPDSINVYVGSSASNISTLFGTVSSLALISDFGYTATIEGQAEEVSYVYFECAMSNYIGRLGEFEIYGFVGEAIPTYTVSFEAGSNGTVTGSTYHTVTEGTLWSSIEVPTATANPGYKFTGWTPVLPSDDSAINSNLTFTANFEYDSSLWSTVTFVAGQGGRLEGTTTVSVPTGTAWTAITVPTVVANDGYTFTGWTPSFPTTVSGSATYTAEFIVTPVDQYVITFQAGSGGSLSGTTVFTVDEGTLWSEITVPTPVANDGFAFVSWTPVIPDATVAIGDNATYTANFIADIGQTLEGVIYINGINASQYTSGGSHIYTINYGSAFTATYWEVYKAGYSEAKGGYIVTDIYEVNATKSVEVDENTIVIAVHMGAQTQPACDLVDVGDLLILTDDINLNNATCVAGTSYVKIYTGDGTEPDKDDSGTVDPPVVDPSEYQQMNYNYIKGMWLSQFDLNGIYMSGSTQRSEASFRSLMGTILDNCVACDINTVYVQVRPNGDSMYPSEYYTMSKYVVGAYGRTATYDPFAIIIEMSHARNLSVQAWINPLRLMSSSDITKVSTSFKVGEWYQSSSYNGKYVVLYSSYYYLNPAYEEVRQLIIDGAKEICTLYNVDGVHMDDYFYPTTATSFDSAAYSAYNGSLSLANWRRQNLNLLVSGIYSAVKSVDSDILFGISPAGNMSTVYNSQYADVYTWCSTTGYIDYICPQVYFGMLHNSQGFGSCSTGWANIVTNSNVTLYTGITLGKALNGYNGTTDTYAGSTEAQYEWVNNRDVIKSSLEYVRDSLGSKCTGVVFFCYQYFYEPTTGASIAGTAEERANFLPVLEGMWTDAALVPNKE